MNTFELIKNAHKVGIKKIIISGTSHEYGNSIISNKPVKANSSLLPKNIYGATKAAAFTLANTFCKSGNLKLYYPRIFSAYGMGQFHKNFWPQLYYAATNEIDFNMTFGDQIVDFIEVESVAEEFLRLCMRDDLKDGNTLIKNIGSGKGISLYDFAKSEWKRIGAKGRIIRGSKQHNPNQIKYCVADLEEFII